MVNETERYVTCLFFFFAIVMCRRCCRREKRQRTSVDCEQTKISHLKVNTSARDQYQYDRRR
jgi:hypothetical protein